jgi:hypothetical protein
VIPKIVAAVGIPVVSARVALAAHAERFNNAVSKCSKFRGGCMGVSDPEVRKKLSESSWVQFKHESEKQGWPWWKRFLHRFERCPTCRPEERTDQVRPGQKG